MEKEQSFQQMVSGKVNIHWHKNKIGLLRDAGHKNQLKMD
jgi:hypothetical protein